MCHYRLSCAIFIVIVTTVSSYFKYIVICTITLVRGVVPGSRTFSRNFVIMRGNQRSRGKKRTKYTKEFGSSTLTISLRQTLFNRANNILFEQPTTWFALHKTKVGKFVASKSVKFINWISNWNFNSNSSTGKPLWRFEFVKYAILYILITSQLSKLGTVKFAK